MYVLRGVSWSFTCGVGRGMATTVLLRSEDGANRGAPAGRADTGGIERRGGAGLVTTPRADNSPVRRGDRDATGSSLADDLVSRVSLPISIMALATRVVPPLGKEQRHRNCACGRHALRTAWLGSVHFSA